MSKYNWSPWHGCKKISTGCKNCWLYYLDERRGRDASEIFKSKTNFNLPLKKSRSGEFKIPSGVTLATCFNSDFFLEEADEWRADAWEIIKLRPDVEFMIPTKRIHRLNDCLPKDWGNGWHNVFISVSVENQVMAQQRLPHLIKAPIAKKGVFLAPLLERVNIEPFLASKEICFVSVSGESYEAARECDFSWVEDIKNQCRRHGVLFDYHQTGSNLIYNGKKYRIPHHKEYSQAKKAFK